MKKKSLYLFGVVSVVSVALMACAPAAAVQAAAENHRGPGNDPLVGPFTTDGTLMGQGNGRGSSTGMRGSGTGYAQTPLTAEESAGLTRAIEEEYTARALYESVIGTFGDVVPFTEIVSAETNHAVALVRQAEKYGLATSAYAPADFPVYATIEEACQAGVDAEIADAALYDELIAGTTHTDLIRVYTNLQNASLNNHLIQFELCN